MTLSDIQALVASVDPEARHYFSTGKGQPYTYWEETSRLPLMSDDVHQEAWRFTVHRFTKAEDDAVAAALFAALDADPGVAVAHNVDYEPDSGYIHHIFSCEGC